MYKCVMLIRTDIHMTKGKIISQCCHGILKNSYSVNKKTLNYWRNNGEKIVSLKVNDYNTMYNIHNTVQRKKIVSNIVVDAGNTQVKANTPTICIIGPDKEEKIDKYTSNLSLY